MVELYSKLCGWSLQLKIEVSGYRYNATTHRLAVALIILIAVAGSILGNVSGLTPAHDKADMA